MRILALSPEPWAGVAGMAQGVRDYLSGLLTEERVEEIVLLARTKPGRRFGLPARVTEHVLTGSPARFTAEAFARQACGRFDLVVCLHPNLMPVANLMKRAFGVPVWSMIHGIDAWEPNGRLSVSSFRSADLVTSSSRYTRARFLAWSEVPPERVRVLNNPVHLDRWSPGPKPPALAERYGLAGRTVLLTAGRLLGGDRLKGHDELLDVLADLRAERPDLAWLIVGDGPDRARLEAAVQAAGMSEHVVFAGWIPDHERVDHYRLADAFALPSRTEGFGIVYLEALACGLPCLGSTLDGSRDPLRDGELGVLVDPRDRADVLAGVRRLLERPKEVPAALEGFAFERMAARMRALLRERFASCADGAAAGRAA